MLHKSHSNFTIFYRYLPVRTLFLDEKSQHGSNPQHVSGEPQDVSEDLQLNQSVNQQLNHSHELACVQTTIDSCNVKYKLKNVMGNGDCFFRCLSLFLNGSCPRLLRKNVCQNISTNWPYYEGLVQMCFNDDTHYISNKNYMLLMESTFEYATTSEIVSAANLYNISICVWLKGRRCMNNDDVNSNNASKLYKDCFNITKYNGDAENTMHLFLHNNHFQLMLDICGWKRQYNRNVMT